MVGATGCHARHALPSQLGAVSQGGEEAIDEEALRVQRRDGADVRDALGSDAARFCERLVLVSSWESTASHHRTVNTDTVDAMSHVEVVDERGAVPRGVNV